MFTYKAYIYIYIYACIYAQLLTYIHIYMYVYMDIWIFPNMQLLICAHCKWPKPESLSPMHSVCSPLNNQAAKALKIYRYAGFLHQQHEDESA